MRGVGAALLCLCCARNNLLYCRGNTCSLECSLLSVCFCGHLCRVSFNECDVEKDLKFKVSHSSRGIPDSSDNYKYRHPIIGVINL